MRLHFWLSVSVFLSAGYPTLGKVTVDEEEHSRTSEAGDDDGDVGLADLDEDNEEDAPWPPSHVTLDGDPALWPGHLQPLGSEFPKKAVEVYNNFPSVKTLYEDYVIPSSTVLLKGAANKLGGILQQWRLASWEKTGRAAVTFVDVETEEGRMPTKMSLRMFAKRLREEHLKINGAIPKEMRSQLVVPRALNCTNVTAEMFDTLLTALAGGYRDTLRSERFDSLTCQIEGTKEILLVSNSRLHKWADVMDEDNGARSGVDVARVDFTEYPSLREARYIRALVEPGDCLFIPYKWLYQSSVRDVEVSFRLRWQHKVFTPSRRSCGQLSPSTSLAHITFTEEDSTTEKEKTSISVRDSEVLFYLIEVYLENGMEMSPVQFQANLKFDKTLLAKIVDWNEECIAIAEELFTHLDLNEDGVFSEEDVDDITPDQLPRLAGLLQDRMADFQDIMNDQQAEKEGRSVDDQMKRYLKDYEKQMRSVMETEFQKVMERAKRMSGGADTEEVTPEDTFPDLYKETAETRKKLQAREQAKLAADDDDDEEDEDTDEEEFKTADELKMEHRKRQAEREREKMKELTEEDLFGSMDLQETGDEDEEEIIADDDEEENEERQEERKSEPRTRNKVEL